MTNQPILTYISFVLFLTYTAYLLDNPINKLVNDANKAFELLKQNNINAAQETLSSVKKTVLSILVMNIIVFFISIIVLYSLTNSIGDIIINLIALVSLTGWIVISYLYVRYLNKSRPVIEEKVFRHESFQLKPYPFLGSFLSYFHLVYLGYFIIVS